MISKKRHGYYIDSVPDEKMKRCTCRVFKSKRHKKDVLYQVKFWCNDIYDEDKALRKAKRFIDKLIKHEYTN